MHGRWIRSLNAEWDFGVQAGLLHGSGGALQKTFGGEIGYLVTQGLWVSVGYNVIGLKDRDLTAGEYTSQGAYIRLRYKFDEGTLGLSDNGRAVTGAAPAQAAFKASLPTAADLASAPPSSSSSQQQRWRPGQPVPRRIVWDEKELFDADDGALTAQGAATLEALSKALNDAGLGPLSVSVGRGDGRLLAAAGEVAEQRANLWLARVGAMRRALQVGGGPRRIGVSVDSAPLATAALEAEKAAVAASSGAATDTMNPTDTVQLIVIAAPAPASDALEKKL